MLVITNILLFYGINSFLCKKEIMIQIYHNPRCSKSREALQLLEETGKQHNVILYLKNELTKAQLTELINKLGIAPIELVRKNEQVWKNEYKGKELTNDEVINAMIVNPKLIERPIVVNGNKAVVARPAATLKEIL